jgi:hypothetical protein
VYVGFDSIFGVDPKRTSNIGTRATKDRALKSA